MSTSASVDKIVKLSDPQSDISLVHITSKSLIRDAVWEFERKNRPRSIGISKLTVRWHGYPFHPHLVAELQRIFALSWLAPKHLGGRAGQMKPNTFCDIVKRALDFLGAVVLRMPSPDMIASLSQLKYVDFQRVGTEYECGTPDVLKRGLKILFHPNAGKLLDGGTSIRPSDIRGLNFKTSDQIESGDGSAYLDDELFTLLSDASVARTQDFLRRMSLAVEDKECVSQYRPQGCIEGIADFEAVFSEYVKWRRGSKKLPGGDLNARYRLKRTGVVLGDMNGYLLEVNDSAQTVIALYTGGRHSELTSFKSGCLDERDGVPCLNGVVFKTRPDIEIMDDTWVAIPAVRDAIRVLEVLSTIKNKKGLFTSLETANGRGLRGAGEPYSIHGLVGMLQRHLSRVDMTGSFLGWRFNTHQFKHSLTRQMIKVKLGLPYISFQLKHLHSRVSSLPSDVTLAYGNAAKLLQSEMAGFHLGEVKRAISRKTFDPDSPLAGGGAKAFDERRKTYFSGLMAAGYTRDQILDSLVDSGVDIFVNVGLGYCSGKKKIDENGAQPPCIGSLKCNPSQCANAVVTQDHAPAWRAVYFENKKLSTDPRFFYGKDEFYSAAEEARGVLSQLGMEVAQ